MATLGTRKRVAFLEEWIDGSAIQSQTRETVEVGNENAEPTISFVWILYDQALNLFTKLLPLVTDNASRASRHQKKILKDTLGSLFLWGDGFRDGRLETVLEESDDLKVSIICGLIAVGRTLITHLFAACDPTKLSSVRNDIQHQIQELDILLEKAKLLLTEVDNESDDDGEFSSSSSDGHEHQHLAQRARAATSLQTFVTCLMDLLPSMTRTLNMAQQEHSEENKSHFLDFFVSGPAQPYVLKVFDRFAKADKRLIERLGEANWQRHIALRKVHTSEMEASTTHEFGDAPKSKFAPVSMFHDSGLGSSKPAQSSYAETVASHSSFASSIPDKKNSSLQVPPTPKEVFEGRPFTCDICGHVLRMIKNRIDWKRHVFSDLKPYICTFSGCQHELLTFPTRKLWEDHEFAHHRIGRSWVCLECSEVFPISEDWRFHLKEKHHIHMTNTQLQAASHMAERRTPRPYQDERCPLCQELPGRSQRHFVSHVAKHMEEISLAALPNDCGSDSEVDSDTSDDDLETSAVLFTGQEPFSSSDPPMIEVNSNGGQQNTQQGSQPKQPQNRTYQACIPCRQRKVRCDFGDFDVPGKQQCIRCLRERKECHFSTTENNTKVHPWRQGQGAMSYISDNTSEPDIPVSRISSPSLAAQGYSRHSTNSKVKISKPIYARPKHDRVQCVECDDFPEGFLGEHELRRHLDRVHRAVVTQWICIEPSPPHIKPSLPLNRCTSCIRRKKYGAYYNAAAHLRRAHFNPRPKGRKNQDEAEKRGGKGGGDWPPMNELKDWMMKVEEPVESYSQSQDTRDEFEENNGSSDWTDFYTNTANDSAWPSPPNFTMDVPDLNNFINFAEYEPQNKDSAFPSTPSTNMNQSETAPVMPPSWEPYPPLSMGMPSQSTYDEYMTTPPAISATSSSANRTKSATACDDNRTSEIAKNMQPMK